MSQTQMDPLSQSNRSIFPSNQIEFDVVTDELNLKPSAVTGGKELSFNDHHNATSEFCENECAENVDLIERRAVGDETSEHAFGGQEVQAEGLRLPSPEWLPDSDLPILCFDISEGKEKFLVRVINEKREKVRPLRFEYITGLESCVPNYERNPVICQCTYECNSRCHCIWKPRSSGTYESAYDETTGLLLEPLSYFHNLEPNVPRYIWECSPLCPCGIKCVNKQVQHGVRHKFEIFFTGTAKGWGVRTRHDIPKGDFIGEYAGQLKEEPINAAPKTSTTYQFQLQSVRSEPRYKKYFIDASTKGNFTRFINHSCDPNCVAVYVFYDDRDLDRGMHVAFFAITDIKKGTEITLDYEADYWEELVSKKTFCLCGSKFCKYKNPARPLSSIKKRGTSSARRATGH